MESFVNKAHINEETQRLMSRQLRLTERIHPKIRNCQLVLDRSGNQYSAKYKGSYKQKELVAEATDSKPLRAFLKAYQKFSRQVDQLKIRKEVNDSMGAFNFSY